MTKAKVLTFTSHCIGLLFLCGSVVHAQSTRRASTAPPSRRASSAPSSRPSRAASRPSCTNKKLLKQRYAQAVRDASRPTRQKVIHTLTSITPANKRLRWRTLRGERHVLVSTWSNYGGYPAPGTRHNTSKYLLWVTAAPALQQACRKIYKHHPCPRLRMKQLLGIPPTARKRWVVEFWVRPQDLFRPCANPDITTRSCGLLYPNHVPARHKRWFERQQRRSYGPPLYKGYPWTQLGYTYDWGEPTPPHVGPSEFIIKKHRHIVVHTKSKMRDYCKGIAKETRSR